MDGQGGISSGNLSNFSLLLDLAQETSSGKRRELMRQVTTMFVSGDVRNEAECDLFDDIVGMVTPTMSLDEQAEISEQVADSSAPVRKTAKRFAGSDQISIAAPVLERSRALTNDDLIKIIQSLSQDHLMAVTRRKSIGSDVSSALVDHGGDPVVGSLLGNEGAHISRSTYEKITDRAQNSEALRDPLVKRSGTPLDLLNDIYMAADPELRMDIMKRMDQASQAELSQSVAIGESRRAAQPPSIDQTKLLEAKRWIEDAKKHGEFEPYTLVKLLREKKIITFVVALAHLVDVRPEVVDQIVRARDIDALATLLKAADVETAIFTSLATLLSPDDHVHAASYTKIYQQVPADAAQRSLRFWKVRQKTLTG